MCVLGMGNMRKMKISKVYGPQNNSYKDEVKRDCN